MKLENVKKLQSVVLFLMQMKNNMELQVRSLKDNGNEEDAQIASGVIENYNNAIGIMDGVINEEKPAAHNAISDSDSGD